MTDDRANIKIDRDAHERHNERREAMGLTWGEYIDGQAPEWPGVDYAQIRDIVREEVREGLREVREGI